jgi:hypothetical protein
MQILLICLFIVSLIVTIMVLGLSTIASLYLPARSFGWYVKKIGKWGIWLWIVLMTVVICVQTFQKGWH